jgi:dephospho-CoA kinase
MLRDGISKEDVLKKIKNQLPDAIKIKKSDFIIENNEKEFLITQSLKIYNSIIT